MIQRIQTIFLFFAGLINLFVFFTPIYSHAIQDPSPWLGKGFALLLSAAMLIAFISIFLYKDRKKQLTWVKIGTYCQIAALAAAFAILFTLGGIGSFLLNEALSVLLVILGLIAYWQAGRFIKKDEELVKSMDRIR